MASTKPPNKNLLRALLAVTLVLLAAGVATVVARGTDDDGTDTASGQAPTSTSTSIPSPTSTSIGDEPPTTAPATTATIPPTTAAGATTTPTTSPATTGAPATTTSRPAGAATTGPAASATTTTFVFGRDQHPDTGAGELALDVGLVLVAGGVTGLALAGGGGRRRHSS